MAPKAMNISATSGISSLLVSCLMAVGAVFVVMIA